MSSLYNFSRLWVEGPLYLSGPWAWGDEGRWTVVQSIESPIKEVVGVVNSGLVSVYLKIMCMN